MGGEQSVSLYFLLFPEQGKHQKRLDSDLTPGPTLPGDVIMGPSDHLSEPQADRCKTGKIQYLPVS